VEANEFRGSDLVRAPEESPKNEPCGAKTDGPLDGSC